MRITIIVSLHSFVNQRTTLSGFASSYLVRSKTCLKHRAFQSNRQQYLLMKHPRTETYQVMWDLCAEVKKSSLSLWMYLRGGLWC